MDTTLGRLIREFCVMAKKLTRSQLVKKCDKLFSIFIRLHFSDKDWYVRCYTCGKRMKRNDPECSCGHRIGRAFQYLRWHINNARPQCMWRCNSKLSGNWEPLIFRKELVNEIGETAVDELEQTYFSYRKDPTKFKVHTNEIETKIVALKELIQQEAEMRGIKI